MRAAAPALEFERQPPCSCPNTPSRQYRGAGRSGVDPRFVGGSSGCLRRFESCY
jgi:hypothetical protein